ncbi:MAG: PPK2 family polyphosphate kinase, partial [Gemmataceae bacterium]
MRRLDHAPFTVKPGDKAKLKKFATKAPGNIDKKVAKEEMAQDVSDLAAAQAVLWASGKYSVLIVLQALDAAGKDGTIKHVMSGVNPQGCNVYSFGPPSAEELRHHFLWRPTRFLPSRGMIAIFNRSYYEEVLVVRVHPDLLDAQKLPAYTSKDDIWSRRFDDINAFEHTLVRNGTCVIKFFLHVSKKEQKKRFLERLEDPQKN